MQIKSIFLSESDEEAIVEFVKQNAELYDKTHRGRQAEEEGGSLGRTSRFQEFICQHFQEDGNQHGIRCHSSTIDHKLFTMTSCCLHHHC